MSNVLLRPGSVGATRCGFSPSTGQSLCWRAPEGPLPLVATGGQQNGAPVGSRGREVRLYSRSAGAPVRLRLGGLNFGPCALSSDTGDCAQIQENWSSGTGSTIGTGKRNISHLFSSGEENSGRVARLPRCSSRERSAPSRALQDGGPVDRATTG